MGEGRDGQEFFLVALFYFALCWGGGGEGKEWKEGKTGGARVWVCCCCLGWGGGREE